MALATEGAAAGGGGIQEQQAAATGQNVLDGAGIFMLHRKVDPFRRQIRRPSAVIGGAGFGTKRLRPIQQYGLGASCRSAGAAPGCGWRTPAAHLSAMAR
jgi:hypothetical protein